LKVPDAEACGRLQVGAKCTHIVSGETRRLSEAEWLEIELGRISFHPNAWTDIRIFIEEACARYESCEIKQVKKSLDEFEKQVLIRGKNEKTRVDSRP